MSSSRLLIAFVLIIAFSSCRQKPCLNYPVTGFAFTTGDAIPVGDTLATVVRYPKGDGFIHPIDSFSQSGNYGQFQVMTDSTNAGSYNYDYLCTRYPSGLTYKVTNVTHEDNMGSSTIKCVNQVHYLVNGVEKVMPGYFGMQGFVLPVGS